MSKISCPFHVERTASLEMYPDGGYYCFGCGKRGRISELPGNYSAPLETSREVENLAESVAHIKTLPVVQVRGLELPCDGESVYILWPDGTFYNRRFFEGETKYKCPSGHKKRPLWANVVQDKKYLCVVEGELNALSVAKACPWISVVSPGGAGDFYSRAANDWVCVAAGYERLALLCDSDRAGAMAGIEAKSLLLKHTPHVSIVLMDTDANDWLVKYGEKALAEEVVARTGFVEMSGGLQTF